MTITTLIIALVITIITFIIIDITAQLIMFGDVEKLIIQFIIDEIRPYK